jgi:hypothetical protein
MVEFWNDGIMGQKEEWSSFIVNLPLAPFFPFFIIPVFHYSNLPRLENRGALGE